MGIQDGKGTMRMVHNSFIARRRMVLCPVEALTSERHTVSDDSPLQVSVLLLHNFARFPLGRPAPIPQVRLALLLTRSHSGGMHG